MSSNDYRQVRQYINLRVPQVLSGFTEWKDSLEDIGNIPKTLLDRIYHITIGSSASSNQVDRHIDESVNVLITIFRRGYNEPVVARDELLQDANCIRLDLINPINIEAFKSDMDGNIEVVESVGLTPLEIDETNDNIIKVEIDLNVRLFLATI